MQPRSHWLAALAGAFLQSAVGTAAFAQTPENAETMFQTRCAACHSLSRAVRPLRALAVPQRRPHLEEFLRRHHVPDAADRALLADYLLATAAR